MYALEPMRLDETTARTGPPTARAALTGRPVYTGYTRDERSYDARDLDQLALLSDHAAAAIITARRRESERAAIATLSSTNTELRTQQATVTWLRDLQQGLTRLLLQDVGLTGIAEFLATRLAAEITIETAEDTVLAASPETATPPLQVLESDAAKRIDEILGSGRAGDVNRHDSPACLVPIPGGGDPPTRMWVHRRRPDPFLDHQRQAMDGCAPLIELDRTRRTDLLATLRAWFAANMSARDAAERVFVHPNTVGYRLNRAARAADLDLTRPADLMTLQLALMVDEIRGGVLTVPAPSRPPTPNARSRWSSSNRSAP